MTEASSYLLTFPPRKFLFLFFSVMKEEWERWGVHTQGGGGHVVGSSRISLACSPFSGGGEGLAPQDWPRPL